MNCPNGHGPMTEGRRFWICEECSYRVERTATGPLTEVSQSLLGGLPSPIAIPWGDLFAENNSVLRLYRLCDAAEITVRFLTITALGETRRSLGDNAPLPNDLLQDLQPNIERPTFGRWWSMLRTLSSSLSGRSDLVIPELIDFVTSSLMPLLDGKDAHSSLISLRNELHHSGGLPLAATQQFLDEWMPRVQTLLGSLAFLAQAQLRFTQEDQSYPLTGPLSLARPDGKGHVLLHRGDKALELWPLLDYGPGLAGHNATRSGSMPSGPRVFLRADRDRLLFAALGVDAWQGESRESLAGFRALFHLDEQRVLTSAEAPTDFEQEIQADADALVGRSDDIRQAKAAIKETPSGVLWIGGPGGMGKSFLMAKLAADLGKDPRKICRLVWRFRAGDGARCSRVAFLRYAVGVLSQWKPLQAEDTFSPSSDPIELQEQLTGLLNRAGVLPARNPLSNPPRILLFLDGLDEIERLDPSFARLPFDLVRPNVVWVCAGRPERTLLTLFAGDRCQHVFAGGLPPMESKDIRAMLLEETGPFKYALLAQDAEKNGEVSNAIVAAIAAQAEGLPLYVRLVISDIVSGHFHFSDVAQKLPPGLSAYYDDLLLRLGIGDLQAVLTPLVVTLAWAFSPLDEEALLYLMAERRLLAADEDGRVLLRQGLEAIRSMVRMAPGSDGGFGYEPYHLTFREHIQTDNAGTLKQQNFQARDQFCRVTIGWEETPAGSPVRRYALQFGPKHLQDVQRWDDLYALARSKPFLQAQSIVLVRDPDAPLETLRLALQGAMAQDDAAKMAEFVILHARRLRATTQETPLAALRNGSLERACNLADLYDIGERVSWYLLLAWELRDLGREADRQETLQRIAVQDLPQLINSSWISDLLILAVKINEAVFMDLSQKIYYKDEHCVRICRHLATTGDIASAIQYAELVQDTRMKMGALQVIVVAHASYGNFNAAFEMLAIFKDDFAAEGLEAALKIVTYAAQKSNWKVVSQAFDWVDQLLSDKTDTWPKWVKNLSAGKASLAQNAVEYENSEAKRVVATHSGKEMTYSLWFEEAAKATEELSDAWTRIDALTEIATVVAQLGVPKGVDKAPAQIYFHAAREAADDIAPTDYAGYLSLETNLTLIALAQLKVGMTEESKETQHAALEAICRCDDLMGSRPDTLIRHKKSWMQSFQEITCRTLSDAGDFEAALAIAQKINSAELVTSTLSQLSMSGAEARIAAERGEIFARTATALRPFSYDGFFNDTDASPVTVPAWREPGYGMVAREMIADALRSQDKHDDAEVGSPVLLEIASTFEGLDSIVRTALKMTGRWRDVLLSEIMEAQIGGGMLAAAEETLAHISEGSLRDDGSLIKDEALRHIAHGYLRQGELALAERAVVRIQDAEAKDISLVNLAVEYSRQRKYEKAEATASYIQHPQYKQVVQQIVHDDALAGNLDVEWAKDTIPPRSVTTNTEIVLTPSQIQKIESLEDRSYEYWCLAASLIKNDLFGEAVQAVQAAIITTAESKDSFSFNRLQDDKKECIRHVLIRIASAGLMEEVLAPLRRLLGEPSLQLWPNEYVGSVSETGQSYSLNDYVLNVVIESVRALARAGLYDQAQQIVEEMSNDFWREVAGAFREINTYRASALCEIATAYIQAKDRALANRMLDAARDTVRAVKDQRERIKALYMIAVVEARDGFGTAALETCRLVIAEGRNAQLNQHNVHCYIEVGDDFMTAWLPTVAWGFACNGDLENFKFFLTPCAYSVKSAYEMCRQLVKLYPDQARRIFDMICSVSL